MPGTKERPAGAPTAGGPAFFVVGKVRRPHGVHGDVLVEVYIDSPEGLIPKNEIFLGKKHLKLIIARRRRHNEGLLLGFEGINTPEQAGRYRNQILSLVASETPQLPKGRYYYHELIDLKVVDEFGNDIGTLTEILETGANNVYVVKNISGREILIPAIHDVVLNVDLVSKIMIVRLLPGLADS